MESCGFVSAAALIHLGEMLGSVSYVRPEARLGLSRPESCGRNFQK